jgi:hypothetical protein
MKMVQSDVKLAESQNGQPIVDNGGGAFPFALERRDGGLEMAEGMTLRDYFAGQALAGLCSHSNVPGLAGAAYQIADAMLRIRKAVDRTSPE